MLMRIFGCSPFPIAPLVSSSMLDRTVNTVLFVWMQFVVEGSISYERGRGSFRGGGGSSETGNGQVGGIIKGNDFT